VILLYYIILNEISYNTFGIIYNPIFYSL